MPNLPNAKTPNYLAKNLPNIWHYLANLKFDKYAKLPNAKRPNILAKNFYKFSKYLVNFCQIFGNFFGKNLKFYFY